MKGDFLGFSFNGVHSDDMGIVRMSDGSRYSTDLTPEIEDRTNSVPGRDGVYFYGSDFKDGKISVKVAFDQLTDRQFRALRKWLGVKEPAPLIFDEFPFKKYMAKLASTPVFDYVCFDERRRWPSETAQDGVRVVDRTTVTEDVPYTEELTVENGSSVIIFRKPETVTVTYESEQLAVEDFDYVPETGELNIHITDVESGEAINVTVDYTIEESSVEIEREQVYPYEYADDVERIYKGEGTIDFEVPFPYAIGVGATVEDIREDASVPEQWEGASYLPTAAEYVEHGINQYDNGVIPVYNCGDVPTGFKLTLEPGSSSGSEGQATGNPITVSDAAGEVSDLTVDLEPVQDLHGYDKPWAAGAGVNKLDESTVSLSQVTLNDGIYTATDGDTRSILLYKLQQQTISGTYISQVVSDTITQVGRISLTFTVDQNAGKFRFANAGQMQEFSFTFPNVFTAGTTVTFSIDIVDITIGASKFTKPQIEIGSTTTTYEPYENICPITGHDSVEVTDTGKNLLNTSEATHNAYNIGSIPNTLFPNTAYTFSVNGSAFRYRLYLAKSATPLNAEVALNSAYISAGGTTTFTTPADMTEYPLICIAGASNGAGNEDISIIKPQLEVGSTASAYESYHGHTTTVTLPHTVYGGDVDVTGGAGTEKYGIADLGSLSWTYTSNGVFYTTDITNHPNVPWDSTTLSPVISEIYSSGFPKNAIDKTIYFTNSGVNMYVKDTAYSSASTFTTAMSGVYAVYELATPTDLTTTPTDITLYSGDNVVSSDGDMDITYVKITTGGITYKDKHLDIDFSIMPFEENDDTAVVVDTFNRVIRGVDSGVLYNKCIVGGDFFLLDPSTDIDDTDEQISLTLENSQFSSITYDYLFY